MIETPVKFKFGFKRLVEEKNKDLFTFPYLTVGIKPVELKERTTFSFTESCRDLLNFDLRENKLSWLYDEAGDKTFYFINIKGVEAEPSMDVTLGLTFSNKTLYDKMVKVMGLDTSKEHYFQVIKVEPIEGLPTVKLVQVPLADIIPSDEEEKAIPSESANELVTLI